jgi:hypothetical protein
MSTTSEITEILEGFWPKNKAKGLLAQTVLMKEVNKGTFGKEAKEKLFSGCWLLAPKGKDFFKFRFCFFVHPELKRADDISADPKSLLAERYRPFHAIAEFMDGAGIGVIYAVALTRDGNLPLEEIRRKSFTKINWKLFHFINGTFIDVDTLTFFRKWEGDRGRPSFGHGWDPQTKEQIKELDERILTELLLTELFYTGFLKGVLKKPFCDPYDVDSFLMSISQKHIFPMEVKEKFPGQNRDDKFFGIDAGRIMMLLRLCIPSDANALYLIRELDEDGTFIGWKYMTLSDIIMSSSWNLQAGGPGMGGQSTQTIRLPYDYFRTFEPAEITEENLKTIGSLPKDAKAIARDFGMKISERFR